MNTGRFTALGAQFIRHTREELQLLNAALPAAEQGVPEALAGLKHLVHRIHGSAAMLGFADISDHANRIEMILRQRDGVPGPQDWPVIVARIGQLSRALHEIEQQRKSDAE